MGSYVPPGWPEDLPPPDTEAFSAKVSGWLLDRCPPQFRATFTVRRHPSALAHVALYHSKATVAGQREAYRAARRLLAEQLSADALSGVLADLEATGHEVVSTLREVELVVEAMHGERWQPKL